MKSPGRLCALSDARIVVCLLSLLFVFSPGSVKAWTYILEDGNSKVTLSADSLEGMKNWCVDGTDQLFRQWFWYRVGNSGGEQSINTLGLDTAQLIGDNQLYAEYSSSKFRIEATFTLMGGAPGSGQSSIGEQIKIQNLSNSSLQFHFFQYTDFDLEGSAAGDTVQLFQDSLGLFNQALQTKGNIRFADTIVSPGANHGEAGIASDPNSLSVRLADNSPTTLSDFAGPLTGDTDWAFQWDRTIAPGEYLTIAITKDSYIIPIPEPAALSLLSAGLIVFGIARRSRKSK